MKRHALYLSSVRRSLRVGVCLTNTIYLKIDVQSQHSLPDKIRGSFRFELVLIGVAPIGGVAAVPGHLFVVAFPGQFCQIVIGNVHEVLSVIVVQEALRKHESSLVNHWMLSSSFGLGISYLHLLLTIMDSFISSDQLDKRFFFFF